jgi:hypothetical protein
VLRVHTVGISDLIALMVAHRRDACPGSVRRTRISMIPDDDNNCTEREGSERQLHPATLHAATRTDAA